MKRDVALHRPLKSSFLSCEKDTETILKKLFITSKPYSDELIKLLVINTKDCLDEVNSEIYRKKVSEMSLARLMNEGYVSLVPKNKMKEKEEVKSYIFISFDNFIPNPTNPYYRDCVVIFDIICHTDYWDIGNYRLRPLKIMGYIDGILNGAKLSGIGTFNFLGSTEFSVNEHLAGYTLMYSAVHGNDDLLSPEELE